MFLLFLCSSLHNRKLGEEQCVSFNPSNLIEIFLQMKINRDQRQSDCDMIFAEGEAQTPLVVQKQYKDLTEKKSQPKEECQSIFTDQESPN